METVLSNINMLINAIRDETHWSEIELPIGKICGLRVDCGIKVRKYRQQVKLVIRSSVFYEKEDISCDDDKYELFSHVFIDDDTLEKKIEKVIKTLQSLTFNRYSGKLDEKKDDPDKQTWNDAWFELLCKHDNIELLDAECCVCMCRTLTKTPCGHHICFECADKIPFSDHDEQEGVMCPLCRADITFGLN